MVLNNPESSHSDQMAAESTQRLSSAGEKPFSEQYGQLFALAIAAALIAGVASLFAGEAILKSYETDLVPALKVHPDPEDMRRYRDARLYSAALTFTTMGGLLGLTMGIAGGLASRSVSSSGQAAILGLLLGTTAAASMSLVLVSVFFNRHDPQSVDLLLPLLTHGAIWSVVGAIGGLAFGLGLGGQGRWKATMMGGLLGAAAATVVYEMVGALLFASSKTDLPVSTSMTTRALAQFLVAILSASGAVLALKQSAQRNTSSSVLS